MKFTRKEISVILLTVILEELLRFVIGWIGRSYSSITKLLDIDKSYYITIPISLMFLLGYFILTRLINPDYAVKNVSMT